MISMQKFILDDSFSLHVLLFRCSGDWIVNILTTRFTLKTDFIFESFDLNLISIYLYRTLKEASTEYSLKRLDARSTDGNVCLAININLENIFNLKN